MKILITYALGVERGDWNLPGHDCCFCETGLGKTLAALRTGLAIQAEQPDLVLNVGTAGTLHHRVGDVFVCGRFLDRDLVKLAEFGAEYRLDFSAEALRLGVAAHGVVSTGDTFQSDADESAAGETADVFDMEAFAGAQACRLHGLPFLSVKYVTDVIGQNSVKHWEDKLADARTGLSDFLKKMDFRASY